MSQAVRAAVSAAIADHGPIAFDEFMELALYAPGGYYERPPIGFDGDFLTSPHVHPMFGGLLAECARRLWDQLGRPDPLRIVEVGAGDGTLARQLLDHLCDVSVDYVAIERSSGARAALAGAGLAVAQDLDELPPIVGGLVIANELLDNLPFRRVRATPDGLAEIRLAVEGDRLTEVEVPADAELSRLAPALPPDSEAVVPTGALGFVDRLARALVHGYGVLIDYGSVGGRPAGEVHGYREHRIIDDLLDDPGSADITAGVDFEAIIRRAGEAGLRVDGVPTQRAALVALGLETWLRAELARQHELLDRGRGIEAVRTWGGRSRATLLVDPGRLGRLRWLAVSTPDAPPQAWIRSLTARSRRP